MKQQTFTPIESFQRNAVHFLQMMVTEPLWMLEDALPSMLSMFSEDRIQALQSRLAARAADPNRVKGQFDIEEDWMGNPIPDVEISPDGVAVIPVQGMIAKGAGNLGRWLGMCDLDILREQLLAVSSNAEVRLIVLYVNSAGGYSIGCNETAKLVVKTAAIKPLMTYTDTIMGSAAYWVAGGAPYVYCSSSSIIGGIGTYTIVDDVTGFLEQMGVKRYVIRSGWAKGIGEDKITAKQLEYLNQKVSHIAEQFKTFISSRRTLIVPANMEGQAFFGDEGVANGFAAGLADSLSEAVGKFTKTVTP
jgi:ClpP class serine protease